MKLFITEFAENKKEIERELKPKTDKVIEHLFKLYLMPESESRNHWITEIANFLYKIDKLAGKNRYPTSKQIYDWTYFKFKDVITDETYMWGMMSNIQDDYGILVDTPIENICKEFDNICESYFKWLSIELSQTGFISRRKIFDKLNELI